MLDASLIVASHFSFRVNGLPTSGASLAKASLVSWIDQHFLLCTGAMASTDFGSMLYMDFSDLTTSSTLMLLSLVRMKVSSES